MKTRFLTFLALLSVLAASALNATADDKIPNVTTVAEPVSILSVDGAKIRAAEYAPDMRSFTALVDIAVTVESNVMCETKSSDRMISVMPYPSSTLSLVQECNVREELTGLAFTQQSEPRTTNILVRVEKYLSPIRDPKTGKPMRLPNGDVQWPKELAQEITIPFGYQNDAKVVKVQYSLDAKMPSISIGDAPKPVAKKK